MTSPLTIVVLAAGQGKRMNSNLPKVLHRLGGQSMLQRVLHTAQALQPQQLLVVVGHGATTITEHFPAAPWRWVTQSQQLGTGHAVREALPHIPEQGYTLVLYGDVPLLSSACLTEFLEMTQRTHALGVLTAVVEQPAGYGRIVRNRDGYCLKIVEDKDANAEERRITEVNTGFMAIPNRHIHAWLAALQNDNAQGEYYLPDLVALAVAEGVPVLAHITEDPFAIQGVNNPLQLMQLERVFQRRQAQQLLQQGLRLADAERFDLRGQLTFGRDVFIDVNCVLEGQIELGADVHIGPHCVLKNVRLGDGCVVEAGSHLEGAVVGQHARIGPMARLRPGAELSDHTHVGNFVEIKNSRLGPGSKANHLSYVGDADVGAEVNLGAGTITCNYDGAHKHRTTIEDHVFVGSGSMLVAPVTLGAGATIGAGSTITRDAPAGELTLSRSPQVSKAGWQRPRKSK